MIKTNQNVFFSLSKVFFNVETAQEKKKTILSNFKSHNFNETVCW